MPATSLQNAHVLRNFATGLLSGLYGGAILITMSMGLYFKPGILQPDPSHGVIYPQNEHGGVLYMTAAQSLGSHLIFWMIPLFFLSMIVMPKKNFRPVFLGGYWQADDPKRIMSWTSTVTALIVIAVAWLFGEQIANALASHGLVG